MLAALLESLAHTSIQIFLWLLKRNRKIFAAEIVTTTKIAAKSRSVELPNEKKTP